MKKLVTLVALLSIFVSKAQDSQLFEIPWILEEVILDGVSITSPEPMNAALLFVSIDNLTIQLETCDNDFSGTIDSFVDNTGFILNSLATPFGASCGQNEPMYNYFLDHARFFAVDPPTNENPNNPFSYTITESGNVVTLIISNGNGDTARYNNINLSIPEAGSTIFNISYNNEGNELIITDLTNHSTLNVYNLMGQKVLETKVSPKQSQLQVILSNGLYIIELLTATGERHIKRFVKW